MAEQEAMAEQEPSFEDLMTRNRRQLEDEVLESAVHVMHTRGLRSGAYGDDVLDVVEPILERCGIPIRPGLEPVGVENLDPAERRRQLEKVLGIMREAATVYEEPVVEAQRLDWQRQGLVKTEVATRPDARGHRHVTRTFPDGFKERITFTTDEDWFAWNAEQSRQETEVEAQRRAVHASKLPDDLRSKLDSAEELFKSIPHWDRHGRTDGNALNINESNEFKERSQLLLRSIHGAVTDEVRKQLEGLITGELVVVPDEQAQPAQGAR